jgi:RNA polymerase sigma-70 factor (ECF subfamily)
VSNPFGMTVTKDEILSHLRERIVAYAAFRLSRDVAEDIAQEVMLILHDKYQHVSRLEELLPLSLQIARFKIMALRRKLHRRGEHTQVAVDDIPLPDMRSNPEIWVEKKEMIDRLTAALSQLGDRCRELFRLKLQGKSFVEIQKVLGVSSINTIYTWDHRCRKQLLELMGGRWEGEA